MAWFSWSIHHVLLPAYVAIVVLGGVYFVLGTIALRAVPERWQALAFGVFVAASFWLRANVPAIHYPHGQPCHCLWPWPWLLGSATLGGEPLANALCGWLAASLVELWRGWRVGAPTWRSAWRRVAVAVAVATGATIGGRAAWAAVATSAAPPVAVTLVEPALVRLPARVAAHVRRTPAAAEPGAAARGPRRHTSRAPARHATVPPVAARALAREQPSRVGARRRDPRRHGAAAPRPVDAAHGGAFESGSPGRRLPRGTA